MVACVSPAMLNYEPTLSTLRYASRARAIQNRVKQNNKYTLEDEIIYLRQQVHTCLYPCCDAEPHPTAFLGILTIC